MTTYSYTIIPAEGGGFEYTVEADGRTVHYQPFNYRHPGIVKFATEQEAIDCATGLIAQYEAPPEPVAEQPVA